MADDSFNGAAIQLATVNIGPLRSISVSEVGAKADVTDADDTAKAYGVGVPDLTITCEVVGGVTVAVGDQGDLDVVWGDIGTSVLGEVTLATCVSVSTQGSMDGEITSTVEFCTGAPIA